MATKKEKYNDRSKEELAKVVADKREDLRALRFNVAGSKTRNVKAARNLRKEIARALTAATAKKHGN
jgi:ribosomal protein L29